MRHHYLIVGGSRGLGRAFAERLLTEGHAVSVVARTAPMLDGAVFLQCDLADGVEADKIASRAREESGELDAVAFFQRHRVGTNSWDGELRTCLTATKQIIEASVSHFASGGLRSIAVVSSVNATFISPHQPLGYHVAKAGLCELVRYFACTLGPIGIRVNAVCPSTFVKPDNEAFYAAHPDIANSLARLSPLNRMATHRDVNDVVMFLLGRQSSFITGQAIVVDGGISLAWPERPT